MLYAGAKAPAFLGAYSMLFNVELLAFVLTLACLYFAARVITSAVCTSRSRRLYIRETLQGFAHLS